MRGRIQLPQAGARGQQAEAGEELLERKLLLPWVQARQQRRGQQEDWDRTCCYVMFSCAGTDEAKMREATVGRLRSYFLVLVTSQQTS